MNEYREVALEKLRRTLEPSGSAKVVPAGPSSSSSILAPPVTPVRRRAIMPKRGMPMNRFAVWSDVGRRLGLIDELEPKTPDRAEETIQSVEVEFQAYVNIKPNRLRKYTNENFLDFWAVSLPL